MGKSETILIIDDDQHIRELIEVNLVARGYAVRQAANGQEGLDAIRQELPDLLILDVMMPRVDGWEVCKVVRDDPETRGLKTIILTAKGSDRDRMVGVDVLGADAYMTKPFDVDALLESVARLLHDA